MQHPDEPAAVSRPQPGLDATIREAAGAPPDALSPVAALDALQIPRDSATGEPGPCNRALFEQALKGLEQLDRRRFRDRRELERVALAIAVQASAVGLSRIDRVALADNGAGYFFTDSRAVDPAMRGYVAHADAAAPDAAARAADAQRVSLQRTQEQHDGDVRQHGQAHAVREASLREDRERAAGRAAAASDARGAQSTQDRDARAAAEREAITRERTAQRAGHEQASRDGGPRRS
jgi:hypothetical protein